MLDPSDLAHCLAMMYVEDQAIADDDLLNWLITPDQPLQMKLGQQFKSVEWVDSNQLQKRFGFIAHPSKLAQTSQP